MKGDGQEDDERRGKGEGGSIMHCMALEYAHHEKEILEMKVGEEQNSGEGNEAESSMTRYHA